MNNCITYSLKIQLMTEMIILNEEKDTSTDCLLKTSTNIKMLKVKCNDMEKYNMQIVSKKSWSSYCNLKYGWKCCIDSILFKKFIVRISIQSNPSAKIQGCV